MDNARPDNSGDDRQRQSSSGFDPGDLAVSAILLAFVAYLYYVTTTFEETSALLGENVGPADFPRLVLYIIAGLAILMPFERLLQPARWQKIKDGRRDPVQALTWLSIVFLLATITAAPYLGTILTMLLVSVLLPLFWGERRWWLILPFSVLFTGAVTWVFSGVLRVFFEPGVFNITTKSIAQFFTG